MQPNQEAISQVAALMVRLSEIILVPFVTLLIAIAFLLFLWGAAQYVFSATDDQAREKGRRHMIYGIIGLFVMTAAWAILRLVAATFGLGEAVDCAREPAAPGCADVFQIDQPPQFNTSNP